MDWQVFETSWKTYAPRLQKQWPNLTNQDLESIAGDKQKLLGKLHQRHGYHANDAIKQLEAFLKGPQPAQPHPVATQAPADPSVSMPAAPPDLAAPPPALEKVL